MTNYPLLSVTQAAQIIGVSAATIRNWARAGHLSPAATHPLSFAEESVREIKKKIGSASFARLQIRANKTARGQLAPAGICRECAAARACRRDRGLSQCGTPGGREVLFLAAIRVLELAGEVCKAKHGGLFSPESYTAWARQSVKSVMLDWLSTLGQRAGETGYHRIDELMHPADGEDYCGLLYQSLSREGDKSAHGSFFTPSHLVADSLSQMTGTVNSFLDPCCGTGIYLIAAARRFQLNPEMIYGFDRDRIAAHLARINLLLAYPAGSLPPG